MIELSKEIYGRRISLRCLSIGDDYLVIISGGREHIGAAALGQCYDTDAGKANSSVLAAYGHKEDEPAMKTAGYLSKALKRNTAVIAGIHFDDLSAGEINEILAAVHELASLLVTKLLKA